MIRNIVQMKNILPLYETIFEIKRSISCYALKNNIS